MTRDWADAPFVRIYNSVFEDEKFATIVGDPRTFLWYVRLLMNAKGYYPTRAPLPRSCPQKAIDALATAGVIVAEGDYYTVCGLAKEMTEVQDGHRAGGLVRAATAQRDESGRFGGTAPMSKVAIPDDRPDIEAFVQVKGRAPTLPQRKVLDDVLVRHGVKWAEDVIYGHPEDPIGAVIEADRLIRSEGKARAIAQEEESRRNKRRGIQDPMMQEFARALKEREEQERVPAWSTTRRPGGTGPTSAPGPSTIPPR